MISKRCSMCSHKSGGLGINGKNKEAESRNKDHFLLSHNAEHETR